MISCCNMIHLQYHMFNYIKESLELLAVLCPTNYFYLISTFAFLCCCITALLLQEEKWLKACVFPSSFSLGCTLIFDSNLFCKVLLNSVWALLWMYNNGVCLCHGQCFVICFMGKSAAGSVYCQSDLPFRGRKPVTPGPLPPLQLPQKCLHKSFWPITPKPGLELTNLVHPSSLIEIQQLRIPLVTKALQICIVQVSHLLQAKPTKGFVPRCGAPWVVIPVISLPWAGDGAACCAVLNALCISELSSQQLRGVWWGNCCQGHPTQSASEGGETAGLHLPACWGSHLVPQCLKVSY